MSPLYKKRPRFLPWKPLSPSFLDDDGPLAKWAPWITVSPMVGGPYKLPTDEFWNTGNTSALRRIRKNILQITQSEMAALTGARQATVSRWERGELEPDRLQLRAIREEAIKRGLAWDDRWFFEPSEA